MTKGYLGWRGVIKLAKELGYSWQEACEVLYRKKINPKTTFDQIVICARIKYELEFIKAGGFLTNYKDGRIIKPNRFENEIHYIVRANFYIFEEFLIFIEVFLFKFNPTFIYINKTYNNDKYINKIINKKE
jgi:hypothetical protein